MPDSPPVPEAVASVPQILAYPYILPCGVELKNRLTKSAMSEQLGTRSHAPGPELVRLYGRWAAGGTGLLITGNVMIDRTALGEPRNVVVEDDRDLPALQAWAAAGTANGTALWMQLNHPGRQSPRFLSREPVAPSAVPLALPGNLFATPRALTATEIEALIGRFARSASVAKQAGFTGVQLHGAHGYLISQFLSPLANVREDDWGGSPERRMRFLLESVRAIRQAVGPFFPIGVKLNSADFQRGGFSEAESLAVVAALETAGIDLLEISGGTYEKPVMMAVGDPPKASTQAREAYFLSYAAQVRQVSLLPLMLTGGFRSAAAMAGALADGAIDLVGLARPLAFEPELSAKLLAGESAGSQTVPRRTGVKTFDSFLEIAWYTQQLHRMGQGRDPNPRKGPWATLIRAALTNGWDSFRRVRA